MRYISRFGNLGNSRGLAGQQAFTGRSLGCDGEEVAATVPVLRRLNVHETPVRLMHQGRSAAGASRAFPVRTTIAIGGRLEAHNKSASS
jgi:hypothetical protein